MKKSPTLVIESQADAWLLVAAMTHYAKVMEDAAAEHEEGEAQAFADDAETLRRLTRELGKQLS